MTMLTSDYSLVTLVQVPQFSDSKYGESTVTVCGPATKSFSMMLLVSPVDSFAQ